MQRQPTIQKQREYVATWYWRGDLSREDWSAIYHIAPQFAEVSKQAGCHDWSFIRDFPEVITAIYQYLQRVKHGLLPKARSSKP